MESHRVMCEFYCQECNGYTYYRLNVNLDGNHTVICANPSCNHKHHRYVKNGQITDQRCNEYAKTAEIIEPMPSAYSKEKRKRGSIAMIRELLATPDPR